ncbi:helix-turn-helix domain-containing protein [Ketobacter sp.]|uniref:helix-turn-helix domain-containing protein n=1 Tax=Ketobacter sp. TaxID=2083498 RepID=UPI000F160269|nr:helix-turn-helix transcriptional regulator [Ketobacter sp.]RLU01654.1 MAG: XRE family transcriptional regulator [Ketobacter sp.]
MRYSRNSNNYSILRAWLKARRLDSGYSIRTLAEKLDVSHSIVGKIEDGTRKLEVFEFIEYCEALGVDPHVGVDVILKSMEKQITPFP